jgi:rhodanese-related sulfurtransferase
MRKEFYALILFAIMGFAMAACGNSASDASSASGEEETVTVEEASVENIEPAQFDSLITTLGDQALLLDVRSPEEWATGIISGSTLLNYYDDSFAAALQDLPKKDYALVYCKAGGRSAEAAELLKGLGYKHVYNLNGGIDAWTETGLSVQSTK